MITMNEKDKNEMLDSILNEKGEYSGSVVKTKI